jgi:GTP-binding protein
MFVDEVDINVSAGDGGRGCLSFRREKFVPRGGPDGGDGGHGGSVYVQSSSHKNTLIDFRFHPELEADRGRHGQGANKTGRSANDLTIKVPVGTLVYEKPPHGDPPSLLADLATEDAQVLVAKGGRGGRGNARFVSSTNRAPRRTEPGESGEQRSLRLQLKLLADIGLVGSPNAGKSTLIARISAARPRIANYPFTTLTPNLGVVKLHDDDSFVVADVPGLIAGAHAGHGLGHRFLRHVERTKLLIHLVDVSAMSGREPVDDFEMIMSELQLFDPKIAAKPQLVAATKMDALDEPARVQRLEQHVRTRHLRLYQISAVTGSGVTELLEAAWKLMSDTREDPNQAPLDENSPPTPTT